MRWEYRERCSGQNQRGSLSSFAPPAPFQVIGKVGQLLSALTASPVYDRPDVGSSMEKVRQNREYVGPRFADHQYGVPLPPLSSTTAGADGVANEA